MKFLVTGARGQLGRAVLDAAAARNIDAIGVGHGELAVEDAAGVAAAMERHRPDVAIHCGAWTDVDGCERDPERAELINGTGTANVARACTAVGTALVYVSTDFVFDGSLGEPYPVDASPNPLSAYGRSKLSGERAVLAEGRDRFSVVRTSWVYGPGGANFPRAILERARSGQPLSVVDDQVGSPTMTRDLAEALLDLGAADGAGGIYHAANEGTCSWHRFALDILERAGLGSIPVATMSSADLDRPASRPAYSVLDCSRLTALRGRPLPHYLDALQRYLSEESK